MLHQLWSDVPTAWREAVGPAGIAALDRLAPFLAARERAGARIFPEPQHYFRALQLTPLKQVRVVILGQDPYHGAGQAHGLSFSVRPGVPLRPSLKNIYKVLARDVGVAPPAHGFLEPWARQGVLLLNTILTVEEGRPKSHAGKGWESLTDALIRAVDARPDPVVFMLWGGPAQEKAALVTGPQHLVLRTSHPSPLSVRRGFAESSPFSQANAFLAAHGRGAIDWSLPLAVGDGIESLPV